MGVENGKLGYVVIRPRELVERVQRSLLPGSEGRVPVGRGSDTSAVDAPDAGVQKRRSLCRVRSRLERSVEAM